MLAKKKKNYQSYQENYITEKQVMVFTNLKIYQNKYIKLDD